MSPAFRLAIPRPAIHPKNYKQRVQRKEYESLYAAVLASRDPGNFKKLVKAVEKGVDFGMSITDDSY